MTVSVVLGDGQLATQDMTAAFANYYVASSSSPHYLTETYLIGSMKVLMGLHRKFQKTILSMKKFSVSVVREKIGFKHVVFFFCLSFSPVPFLLPSPCTSSNLLFLFYSEVCKICRELQR